MKVWTWWQIIKLITWTNINVQMINRFGRYSPSSVNRAVDVVKVGSMINKIREWKGSWHGHGTVGCECTVIEQ